MLALNGPPSLDLCISQVLTRECSCLLNIPPLIAN